MVMRTHHDCRCACHGREEQPPAESSLLPYILIVGGLVYFWLKWKGWV